MTQTQSGLKGFHVWWDFTDSGAVARPKLEEISEKYDLKDYLPRKPTSGRAMRRTMKAADKQLKEKDFHWDLVAADDAFLVYRMWRVERSSGDADMKKEVLLKYSKEHEMFLLDPPPVSGASLEIQTILMPIFLTITTKATTTDISVIVSRALEDCHRIPLKRSGHIYFVDQRFEAKLNNLEAFMVECGHRFYVNVAFTREQYVTEGVEHSIQLMLQRVTSRTDSIAQQRSFDRALSDLDNLEEMTSLYGTVLAGAKRLIDKEITAAREAVNDRLLEVTRLKEEEAKSKEDAD